MGEIIFKPGRHLIFDGAMGTSLQNMGLRTGELPELYNLQQPELVKKIHRAFLEAGADVISTNTFQANREKLAASGCRVEEVIEAAVSLAREAGAGLIALAMGPLPGMLRPVGETSFVQAYELYRQQVLAGVRAGADLILIETQADIYQAKAAVLAAKENSSLPVFCTLTFQEDGRTFLGTDPRTAVHILEGLGVDCLGANCSLGPQELLPILAEMADYSRVPLLVQANAGLPRLQAGETVFPVGPEDFAACARKFADLGVAAIGGCCGTTPAHIKAVKACLAGTRPKETVPRLGTCACSPVQTVFLNKGTIIGERLNPTGNKELKAALRAGDVAPWLSLAIAQVEAGAQLLDVNVGLPSVDEVELLPRMVEAIQAVVDTPLVLDSADPAALAAAARVYNGKPIINSVSGKDDSLEKILPIVKKYGAAVIGLTLDKGGLPATARERLTIGEKILLRALAYGIPREDIIIDCLTLTAAAQQDQICQTLKAINLHKNELGLATVLGISNVSHGLPRRGLLNSTFLIQAFTAGLDAAIVDPLTPEINDSLKAWRVLIGQDANASEYIQAAQPPVAANKSAGAIGEETIQTLIAKGDKAMVASFVRRLAAEKTPQEIIRTHLVPGLTEVGRDYDKGKIFLPQLLRAAESIQAGLAELKKGGANLGPTRGKIILATVQGDIHDIGKNIAKLLLENQGFSILDLGKDIAPEAIVAAVKKQEVKLVGLSALMTTTVSNMARTILALKREAPSCQIMVGGAVLTASYAKEIGADFYAPDALSGVKIAVRVYEGKGSDYPQRSQTST